MIQNGDTPIDETIRRAIAERRILIFRYKDVGRTVNPHIFGVDRRDHRSLSGWQTAGTGVGWRLFHVASIETLSLSDGYFRGSARGYNKDDPSFARILARLEH